MFVKFKRPYFSKDAVHYPPRVWLELGDDMKDVLPSDAEVAKTLPGGGKEIPDRGPKAIPGFGAQPVHEQELALVGANETHLMVEAAGEAPAAAAQVNVTDKGKPTGSKPSEPSSGAASLLEVKDDPKKK